MPIYKIPSRRSTGRRAQNALKWVRLIVLILSGLLISGTVVLLLHSGH